jgi:hypothetical protein
MLLNAKDILNLVIILNIENGLPIWRLIEFALYSPSDLNNLTVDLRKRNTEVRADVAKQIKNGATIHTSNVQILNPANEVGRVQ